MSAPYKVIPFPKFARQLKSLVRKATAQHRRDSCLLILGSISEKLKSAPKAWGDPIRDAAEGGVVYRGIVQPIIVDYVLFEDQKLVWIIDIRPWPGSGLD